MDGLKITLAEVGHGYNDDRCHSFLLEAILKAVHGYKQLADLERVIHAGMLKWLGTLQVMDWSVWHIR